MAATGGYSPGAGGTAFPGTGSAGSAASASQSYSSVYSLTPTDAKMPVKIGGVTTTIGQAVQAFEAQDAATQIQMSQTLISAGFLKPTGAADPVSVTDAYIAALRTAAFSKSQDFASTIQDWTQTTSGSNSVTATIDLTNPLDVAYASNTIAQQLIGRKLTSQEIAGISSALQGQEMSAGTDKALAQISQVTGGAVGSRDPGNTAPVAGNNTGTGPQAFVNSMAPYAVAASKATGINANVILAQWGNETGWGTSHAFKTNFNPAGIGITGSGVAGKNYGSIAGGVQAYIDFVNNNSRYQKVKAAGVNNPQAQAIAFGNSGWAAGKYDNGSGPGSSLIADMNAFTAPSGVTPAAGISTTSSQPAPSVGETTSTQVAPGASILTDVQPTTVDAETNAYLSEHAPGEYQGHELLGVFQAIADKVANDTAKQPKALSGPVKVT